MPCRGCGKNQSSRLAEAMKAAGFQINELGPFIDHVPAQPVELANDTVESSSEET